jgi:hypothetical protein
MTAPACTPPPCAPPAPPPYSFIAPAPPRNYMPVSVAAWGRFPEGPAYASPRESTTRLAYGWPVLRAPTRVNYSPGAPPAARGLAGACGPCQLASGGDCVPCPNDADVPECAGCVDGAAPSSFWEHPLFAPVVIGVVTTVATAVVVAALSRAKLPVGG